MSKQEIRQALASGGLSLIATPSDKRRDSGQDSTSVHTSERKLAVRSYERTSLEVVQVGEAPRAPAGPGSKSN